MLLIEKLKSIDRIKFSFGKNDEYLILFSREINACSMHDEGFGIGVPREFSPENKLRAVFTTINKENGVFVFNINGVDLAKAKRGFADYDEAYGNNMITECELSVILSNEEYIQRTVFHN